MPLQPCDQLAADTLRAYRELTARNGYPTRLNINRVEAMVNAIDKTLSDGVLTDNDEIVGFVLGDGNLSSDEYEGYKLALNYIYQRRQAHALQAQRVA